MKTEEISYPILVINIIMSIDSSCLQIILHSSWELLLEARNRKFAAPSGSFMG